MHQIQGEDNQNQSNNDTSGDEENNDKQDIQDKVSEDQLSVETDYDVNEFRMDEQLVDTDSDQQSSEHVIQKLNRNTEDNDYKIFTTKFDEVAKAETLESSERDARFRCYDPRRLGGRPRDDSEHCKRIQQCNNRKASECASARARFGAHAITLVLTCLVIDWCMRASYMHGVERTYTDA